MAVDWLAREDADILELERGVIAGHTCKLLQVGGEPLTVDAVRAHVAARLDAVPRLRSRLARVGADERPAWVVDDRFDVAAHVLPLTGARELDAAALPRLTAELMSARLDRSRPLWTLHVGALRSGGSALLLRLHHALADGSAAMAIASRILWDEEPVAAGHQRPAGAVAAGGHRGSWRPLLRELAPSSRRSVLDAPITSGRGVAFAHVPFEALRRIEHAVGGATSINDVVLCGVAGGLRRGLTGRLGGRRLRAKVPVSLHRPGDGHANRDSFICVDLDIREQDALRRLQAITRQASRRKLAHDAETVDRLLHGPPLLARLTERWAMSPRVFALNISNVRGPQGALSVLGMPVNALYTVAEVARHHALRVACISAAEQMTFGLCADRGSLPRPEAVAAGIEAELDELSERTGR